MRHIFCIAAISLFLIPAAAAQDLPKGSDRAVAAFHERYPGGVLDEVRQMGPGDLAAGTGDPLLYWIFRFHTGADRKEAYISPSGVLVRSQEVCPLKDLPGEVSRALDKNRSALKRILRQETSATLKFAEAPSPVTSYIVTVEKDKKRTELSVSADAPFAAKELRVIQDTHPEEEESPGPPAKEMPVPERAAAAVKAVKALYPRAILQDVEDVAYDDMTGHVEVAYFEVEISLDGKPKTVLATPDGILLYSSRPHTAADLPQAVLESVLGKVPGGTVVSAVERKENTIPRFVALDQPRVVYMAEFAGKKEAVRYSPDGKVIKPLTLR